MEDAEAFQVVRGAARDCLAATNRAVLSLQPMAERYWRNGGPDADHTSNIIRQLPDLVFELREAIQAFDEVWTPAIECLYHLHHPQSQPFEIVPIHPFKRRVTVCEHIADCCRFALLRSQDALEHRDADLSVFRPQVDEASLLMEWRAVVLASRVPTAVQSSPADLPKSPAIDLGVSLQDVALALPGNENDKAAATKTVDRWRNLRDPKVPKKIGKDPHHRQRDLFALPVVMKYVELIEGPFTIELRKSLRERLQIALREPLNDKTESKSRKPTAKLRVTKPHSTRKK